VGFPGAPRAIGFDDEGREVLTYIDGQSGSAGFPQPLLDEAGLVTFGCFMRAFHDAVSSFVPASDAVYRIGARPLGHGEIVCHGDPGYWNTVWRGDDLVAFIDWDFAEPAAPIHDLALAAMPLVPLHADELAIRVGFLPPLDRRGRLAALCAGYGEVTPAEVVRASSDALKLDMERLQDFGAAGREPWASFLGGGQLRLFETIAAWIAENRASVV
jgi:hypothetical protein